MNGDDRYAEWDAAYVLGGLSASERREFERHLAECASCAAAVAGLAGLPGLLAKVPAAEAETLLDDPVDVPVPATLLPRLVGSVRRRRRRARGYVAGGLVAAAAAAAAIVLTVPLVAPSPAPSASQSSVPVISLAAVVPSPLRASVRLVPTGWGTRLEMDCSYGTPSPDSSWSAAGARAYSMFVTDAAGNASQVATWTAAPGTTAEPYGTTDLAVGDIRAVDVRAADGTVLLQSRL